MSLDNVEKLLKDAIGLDRETVGASTVQYAVKQRMAACGATDAAAYWRHLTTTEQELQELVNAVIVPETWFFRDPKAFDVMTAHARARLSVSQPLRLLSLPCSTGEEPYSMAMALFDAGFEAGQFQIDAIDISTRNLAGAAHAVYGRNSFRGADIDFRARHFEKLEAGFRPHAAIRDAVRFRLGNLLDPAVPPSETIYDMIFCRNLLIYFDRDLQHRALVRLKQMLATDGLLLVGPAEAGLMGLHGFSSLRTPMAFAFVKGGRVTAPADSSRPQPTAVSIAARAAPRTAETGARPTPSRRPFSPPRALPAATNAATDERPTAAAGDGLSAIRRAADAGRLAEARAAAQGHVEIHGPSGDAFYLLGLICDAENNLAEAAKHYRKALYLLPDHPDALAQLALLLRRQGDVAGARRLTERLNRLTERSVRQ
ncbi:tetratricopeptide repeat protein [Ancylobacter sp. A5.8]|uniref:CheR family methyltransferase n=1 Tax=Ancylobacter gelatini TaxID=2919920 RepID=UPI001F4EC410|nr:CheR family methyltransferase [Ancylobacter gelatini]MCJ8141847.1 tetratricopeptide repeat protein [Ancylobacter gelatini]